MIELAIGYLPLADAASLIVAADFGFAEGEGLALRLWRDVSWANLRDKLLIGDLHAAHFLAPLAIATSLGVGNPGLALRAPFVLNVNGNAITVSPQLWEEMSKANPSATDDASHAAAALGAAVKARRARGVEAPAFASVFAISSHTYMLRRFFEMGRLDPDHDLAVAVVPPPLMIAYMERGLIDGFCVGSPWNSIAASQGKGVIVAFGSEFMPAMPEKLLVLPEQSLLWENETASRLVRALDAASRFVSDRANVGAVAERLSRPDRLDAEADVIALALTGDLLLDASGRRRSDPGFLRFAGAGLNRPAADAADRLYALMRSAGHGSARPGAEQAARDVFGTDAYDRALRG
ncbi:MAG: ABC transporter substrate-binding protein [Methylocystis sp.]|nr:ABC transporter substrate-binding protein [Methylocystis sp.]MBI3276081.1 ABC transporter substrate-binding protein [Methylocystis sp.]